MHSGTSCIQACPSFMPLRQLQLLRYINSGMTNVFSALRAAGINVLYVLNVFQFPLLPEALEPAEVNVCPYITADFDLSINY